jgi:nucleoside-diphosphate-sugar epimerase
MSDPILLTGGNGFVGSHVAEKLLEAGYNLRCLLRKHSKLSWIETLPVDIQRADYFDPNALRNAIKGCRAILHFGGATKAPNEVAYMKANGETVKVLLEAAAAACPDLELFLYCSSQAALGPSQTMDLLTEEAPTHPISIYGRSKLEGEKHCRAFENKFPITIIRSPAIYGPRDTDVLIYFRAIKWGISPSIGRGNRFLSMVNGLDVANVTRLIVDKMPQGFNLYHVTDGEIHNWENVGRTIAEAMGKRPIRVSVPVGTAVLISKIASGWASALGRMAISPAKRRGNDNPVVSG